jgi:hypothetical protein
MYGDAFMLGQYSSWRLNASQYAGHAHRTTLQFPKIPLALGGGMWHTISVLPLKGEITVYSHGGRLRKVVAAAFGSTMRGIESAADRDNSATDPESNQRQSAEGVCFILLSGASCAVV